MIINYKQFNERLGIIDNMEDQVDSYIKVVNDNPNKNEFEFIYISGNKQINFSLKIDTSIKVQGYFMYKSSTIFLKDRTDVSTFLHEVKHLDYSLKGNKHSKYSNSYNDINPLVSKKNIKMNLLSSIFYYYDSDEFQAQYHSIYKEFDIYLKDIVKYMSKDDITYKFIKSELDKFMIKEFYMLSVVLKIKDFKFIDFFNRNMINNTFSLIINNDEIDFDNINFINLAYKAIRNYYKELYTKIFNHFSKEKLSKIEKLTKYFERDINIKNKKYNRKIYRIVTIMYDKYN